MTPPRTLDTSPLARLNAIAGLAGRDPETARARFLALLNGHGSELVAHWHLVEAVGYLLGTDGGDCVG